MRRQNSNVLISVAAASLVAGAVVAQAQFTLAWYEFGTSSPGTFVSTDQDGLSVASTLSVQGFTGTSIVSSGTPANYYLQLREKGIPNNSRNTGYYLEFTVNPNDGRQLNLESFRFDAQVYNSSGPKNWSLWYDLNADDGESFAEFGGGQFSDTAWATISPSDFGNAFQGLANTVAFRLYLWDEGNLNNQNRGVQLDNITVIGRNVPEPASGALVAGLGLGAFAFLRRRVNRKA